MASQVEIFQLILKFRKLASLAMVYLMIMECMLMKKPDVKHTMFVTMVAKIHSFAVLELFLINAFSIATTGIQWIVENQANIIAQTLIWEVHNQSQGQLKLRKAPTSELNRFLRVQ